MLEIPPTQTICEVVQKMKAYASIYLKKRFNFISRIYDDGNIWSVGYFVSTVGLNEEQIRKYIQKQNKFDVGEDVTQEFSWVAEQKKPRTLVRGVRHWFDTIPCRGIYLD